MPSKKAFLVLEDGSVFEGETFGAANETSGEVVFNTSMTGYQEILTDPSYAGQIVVPTYPIIGNYGINAEDFESRKIQVRGFVVRDNCERPSHWQSHGTIGDYLESQGIPGISGVDTRAITRKLRMRGVMMGIISSEESPDGALDRIRHIPNYGDTDYVRSVSTEHAYVWADGPPAPDDGPRITVVDMGVKYNIMRILKSRGCHVMTVPAWVTAEAVMETEPDGIVLSPGPGDPALLHYMVSTAKKLAVAKPVLGICLGHQVLAHAFGGNTFKLKFGHRGGNHPVRDNQTGRVHITAQNHGYAVDGDSLPSELEVSHVNLNDGTVEGLRHRSLPVFSIQYHSEASPGPLDNVEIFDRFITMVNDN